MVPWFQVYEYNTPAGKQLGLSADPEADKEFITGKWGTSGFRVLSAPLPLGQVFHRYQALRNQSLPPDEAMGDAIQKRLATCLGHLLEGRILLWEEIGIMVGQAATKGMEEMGVLASNPAVLLEVLQVLAWWGHAAVMPAVDERCNRCGNSDIKWTPCEVCSPERGICQGCYQCEECISMGVSRSCTPLWRFSSLQKEPAKFPVAICLDFELTLAQQQAAKRVLELGTTSCNILVIAACGAGKTEITFAAIARTLESGGRVLFAIPRRDVVRDLEPRLKKAFPGVNCITIYGGSGERFAEGQLVLATTHQVIRFYRCFDLVILDEVDAYPYRDSAMLHFGMERAVRLNGKMILMTATPTPELLRIVKQGKAGPQDWTMVTIPARHHGYPLPVPAILVDRKMGKDWSGGVSGGSGGFRLSDKVMSLIHSSLVMGRRLFIFVPVIRMAGQVADYLENKLGDTCLVKAVHSRAPRRDELIMAFKEGRINILVTTTIMERGVTVPNCDVLVLLADLEKIFDTGTLVQMAGRAGRVTAYPTGRVWFAGGSVSRAMRQAVTNIEKLNTLARQGGHLKQGF